MGLTRLDVPFPILLLVLFCPHCLRIYVSKNIMGKIKGFSSIEFFLETKLLSVFSHLQRTLRAREEGRLSRRSKEHKHRHLYTSG